MQTAQHHRAYLVRVRDVDAGLAVKDGNGYRFYALHRAVSRLEGTHFLTPAHAERSAQKLMGEQQARSNSMSA